MSKSTMIHLSRFSLSRPVIDRAADVVRVDGHPTQPPYPQKKLRETRRTRLVALIDKYIVPVNMAAMIFCMAFIGRHGFVAEVIRSSRGHTGCEEVEEMFKPVLLRYHLGGTAPAPFRRY